MSSAQAVDAPSRASRASSDTAQFAARKNAVGASAPLIAQWFRLWLLFHWLFSRSEQPRQLGDVRRDPPCLVAGQTDSSPKRYDAAIMSAIGGKAEVRDLRLKRRTSMTGRRPTLACDPLF
jgi:hypothetical protein